MTPGELQKLRDLIAMIPPREVETVIARHYYDSLLGMLRDSVKKIHKDWDVPEELVVRGVWRALQAVLVPFDMCVFSVEDSKEELLSTELQSYARTRIAKLLS